MKKPIAYILLVSLFACHKIEFIPITRIIKNDSSHTVHIEGYNPGRTVISTLKTGEFLEDFENCYSDYGSFNCDIYFIGYDSVRVVFDTLRYQLFCSGIFPDCWREDRNIMDFDVFDPEKNKAYVEDPKNTFTYTIVDEDFDSAIFLD